MKLLTPRQLILVLAIAAAPSSSIAADEPGCGADAGQGGGFALGRKLELVALTADQRLTCFSEKRPAEPREIGVVTGLAGDTALGGIDFRPANGQLYGLGNAGGIYTVDVTTATATFRTQLSVALSGASFGIDFNPTVDRLRVVSDNGQNLRVNVDTGAALVDGALNYPAAATGVTGVAYTNNDADPATATTLYDVDAVLDQIAIQAPPNAGSLNPTGKLGVDAAAASGFDIHSTVRDGTTVDIEAFAALSIDGRSRLYEIDLFTGRAGRRGSFPEGDEVIGLAIPLGQR